MATFENVEKLRARANVTYEEARQALDACNDDLLDAMIYLENQGKVAPPAGGGRYSYAPPPNNGDGTSAPQPQYQGESFEQLIKRFGRFLKRLLHKGNTNSFEVWRRDALIVNIPVTVLVLLLICCFWVVIPLMVVGLFCGCRYRFRGADFDNTCVNRAMDGVSEAAENLKREINTAHDDENGDNH